MSDPPLLWLFGLERLGMKFGLENMRALAAELGEPQRRFRSVHVAGTNGKGSVTAMVETALRTAGVRSARYTSPHLVRLEERFVIDGRTVETAALEASVARVREAVDRLLSRGVLVAPATFFECATAAAFDLFAGAGVEVAVLEVGLGGRLDATNIVEPMACAITTIDLDHQAQLGSTLREIAAEKAGIIKPGVPVVVGRVSAEADEVITAAARERRAPLVRAADVSLPPGVTLALPGAHQRDNARVAVALLETLAPAGVPVPPAAVAHALAHVEWPGRLERRRRGEAEVILDAAHNPAGARALAAYLADIGWTDATLVFGAMADKDARGMLAPLAPVIARVVCTTAPTPRAATAAALAEVAAPGLPWQVEAVENPEAALTRACSSSPRVVVAGSMFLVGPLRDILR